MTAKSNVINANETTRSKVYVIAAPMGRTLPTILVTAVKTALMTSETRGSSIRGLNSHDVGALSPVLVRTVITKIAAAIHQHPADKPLAQLF